MDRLKEFADKMDGVEYRLEDKRIAEIVGEEKNYLGYHGIVVAFSASDDLLELRGAHHEEYGAWDGTELTWFRGDFIGRKELNAINETIKENSYHSEPFRFTKAIEAVWCPKNDSGEDLASFEIIPTCKYEKFNVMEDGEVYCIGAVFYLEECIS